MQGKGTINEAAVGLAAMQARRRGETVDFNKKKAMALIYLFAGVLLGSEATLKKAPVLEEIILQRNLSSG